MKLVDIFKDDIEVEKGVEKQCECCQSVPSDILYLAKSNMFTMITHVCSFCVDSPHWKEVGTFNEYVNKV